MARQGLANLFPDHPTAILGDSAPESRLRQALCHGREVKLLVLVHGDNLLIPSYAIWELVQDFPNPIFHCSCFK